MRAEAARFEDHADGAGNMILPVKTESAAHIGAAIGLPFVSGILFGVGGEIGISQFVVFAFGNATSATLKATQLAQRLAFQIALQMGIEQLVVAQLVGSDAAADVLQRRLIGFVGHGGVVGAGAGFDHAAGDQFASAATPGRFRHADIERVAFAETGIAGIKIIGGSASAAQRPSA